MLLCHEKLGQKRGESRSGNIYTLLKCVWPARGERAPEVCPLYFHLSLHQSLPPNCVPFLGSQTPSFVSGTRTAFLWCKHPILQIFIFFLCSASAYLPCFLKNKCSKIAHYPLVHSFIPSLFHISCASIMGWSHVTKCINVSIVGKQESICDRRKKKKDYLFFLT